MFLIPTVFSRRSGAAARGFHFGLVSRRRCLTSLMLKRFQRLVFGRWRVQGEEVVVCRFLCFGSGACALASR